MVVSPSKIKLYTTLSILSPSQTFVEFNISKDKEKVFDNGLVLEGKVALLSKSSQS